MNDRPLVVSAPCCGVRSVVTPGVITEKLMKLRPLIGSDSICGAPTTDATAVCRVPAPDASAVTVTVSSRVRNPQDDIEHRRLAELQDDAVEDLRGEAGTLDGDLIRARSKRRRLEPSAFVRANDAGDAGLLVDDRHRGVRKHAADLRRSRGP